MLNAGVKEQAALLERAVSLLESIDRKLDLLSEFLRRNLESGSAQSLKPIEAYDILTFPAHLQKTSVSLVELGEATADQIAAKTGRQRSIESLYLNELVQQGYARKRRKGRVVYFAVAKE